MADIKLGVTLYSFTYEYVTGKYSLEDCVRKAAELGVDGYEIVATQMIPSYPYISDEFLAKVSEFEYKYGIRPVAYGANTDRGKLHDRDLNDEELVNDTIRDIQNAHKLGCKVVRAQYLLSPENLVRIAPYAEEYDVKVGIEIHNPETPSTPAMQRYLEAIEKSGSTHIGFVPDLGCFATKPNIKNYDGALKKGANKEMLDYAVELKRADVPLREAEQRLKDKGADPHVMSAFYDMYGYLTFYNEPDLDGLRRIMPYVFHFHGKFHAMRNGEETSIPYPEVLEVIFNTDFSGYIVSEYEGHSLRADGLVDYDAFEAVRQHLEMERRILAELGQKQK